MKIAKLSLVRPHSRLYYALNDT